MMTTIQVSGSLVEQLKERKLFDRESYEEIIWDLIEDSSTISAETKKELELARIEIKEGKVHSFERVKQRLGLR